MSQNKQNQKTGQQDENPADIIDFDCEELELLPDMQPNESKNPENEENVSQIKQSINVLPKQKSDQEKKEDAKNGEPPAGSDDERNARSVFVKNVHFAATTQEIEKHFQDCGPIQTVTILKNKMTHQPQGLCYIEFQTLQGAQNALGQNDSLFRGRLLTVQQKRVNVPGMGRARRNNPMAVMAQLLGGFGMRGRGRGGFPFRGRGRGGFRGGGGPPGQQSGQGDKQEASTNS